MVHYRQFLVVDLWERAEKRGKLKERKNHEGGGGVALTHANFLPSAHSLVFPTKRLTRDI